MLQNIERGHESLEESWRQSIVGRRRECEQVDVAVLLFLGGRAADELAAGGNGDGEEL